MALGRLDQGAEPAQADRDLLEQLPIGRAVAHVVAELGPGQSGILLVHGGDYGLRSPPMEITVAGGAVIDLATREDHERGIARLAGLMQKPHARYFRAFGGRASRASNAPFAIQLQPSRPPGGMLWLVQWALFTGSDPSASAAIANVRAALFVGSIPPDSNLSGNAPLIGADSGGLILPGQAVPSLNTMPDKSVVYASEDLYALFVGSGLNAGDVNGYRVNIGILELPATPEALLW